MNIKLYTKNEVYKKTINPNIIKNDVSFSSQINGGLGNLVLNIDLKINDTTFEYGDIIKIEKNGKILYSGIIDEINKSATNFQELEIVCNGYGTLFARLVYEEGGNYKVSKDDTASNIMSQIVDFFNTKYNYLSKNIESSTGNVKYETDYTTLLDYVKGINNLAENYFWIIDENGKFNFLEKTDIVKNTLTFEKNIFELRADEDSTELVNNLILEWKDNTTIYNDVNSQNLYGIRTKKVTDTNITDLASANKFAEKYFEENAKPKKKIQLTINNGYEFNYYWTVDEMTMTVDEYLMIVDDLKEEKTIENIGVGENIKILNLNHNLGKKLLISKKVYNKNRITLDLENYDNFINLIKK